ncbi:FAD-dependent oxidoreductase [Desulfobaculum bizertense]|uniref:Thioredoxin reductase (NADPH) n=1 Tax=Desulfobaculum bizertense DSM 18034 TaxID=1121442 RepID=A0A1T4VDD8_9BACT|nr:FAD-dependent oxidoreductase [Desulfobaculum bizertense]UIJ37609.1 FAD-dependent oxidoreductase [Desulfobaculum bizertense]SKA62970.1 thioredoxin reductase (NADPH) [Desulfobaculum bizertense DSM 18034]
MTSNEHSDNNSYDWFIPEESRDHLREAFEELQKPVYLELFTRNGDNDAYNEATVRFCRDLAVLSDKVVLAEYSTDSEQASKRGVDRSPCIVFNPDELHLTYIGAPLGQEARAFVEVILHLSAGDSGLSAVSREMMAELSEEREVKVFVSPTCPYCPGQMLNAFRAAIENPKLVSAICIETSENQDLALKYQASSLPKTVINETFTQKGLFPEERFIVELVNLRTAEELLREHDSEQPEANVPKKKSTDAVQIDVVVIGAGPAGLAASIYTERAGLSSIVLEKNVIGGQVSLTPEVENYPGYKRVGGIELMDLMANHAREYSDIKVGEEVEEIKVGKDLEVFTNKTHYIARAVILATGATAKMLGVPGENDLFGRGVSVCASCDGWAYKGKSVIVVGGGSSALTEALHLHNMGVKVTLVHRRDAFRAEKHLQKNVEREGIQVLWNTVVEKFVGDDDGLKKVHFRNVAEDSEFDLDMDGAFIAIGWKPETPLAQQLGVKTNDWGYIDVDRHMRTNIPRVYACGDVIGGVQQIVTAVGEGATAALAVFEDISNPYWKEVED